MLYPVGSRFIAFLVLLGCAGNMQPLATPAEMPDVDGAVPDGQGDGNTTSDGATVISVEDLRAQMQSFSPEGWSEPPEDVTNAYAEDPAAAALGQKLFFDTRFSGPLLDTDNDGSSGSLGYVGETGKVACASCHMPGSGFVDSRSHRGQISLAAGWGTRKAPSLLNVAHAKPLMWDGRHDTHHGQVFGPIEASFEFNSSRLFAAQQMYKHYRAEYEAIFGEMPALDDAERFPPLAAEQAGCDALQEDANCHGKPGDEAEYDSMSAVDQDAVTRVVVNMGKAISAYERLLVCGSGRFDAWVHGDDGALTESEVRGAALFVGKAACANCHSGPVFTDNRFYNVGLEPKEVAYGFIDENDPGASVGLEEALSSPLNAQGRYSDGDDGRLPDVVGEEMLGAFRTPTLRCVSMRETYMHTGQINTLEGVVDFFTRGGDAEGFLGHSVNSPRDLSLEEQKDLVAFLRSLDGTLPAEDLMSSQVIQ